MYQLYFVREHGLDPVPEYGVSVPPANLHDVKWTSLSDLDALD